MLEYLESLGLQAVAERDAAGGPLLEEEETVMHKFERVQLVVGAAADQGEGTLFITEWRIVWLSTADAQRGFSVDFPTITMHAVATEDEAAAGRTCLYVQLDNGEDEEGGLGAAGSGSEGEDEGAAAEGEAVLPELRLIPADPAQLESLFQAFCEGAERNPDFSDDDEDEEGGGFFYNEDEVLAGAAAAALGVGDVDELVGEDASRFDDAEGDEAEQPPPQQPNGGL